MSRLATSRPILTVMLLIAAMVLPAAGIVRCIGFDGHMAIEPAHLASGCDDVEGRTSTSDNHLGELAPGDCIDLPLAAVVWMPRPEQDQVQFDAITLDLLTAIYLVDMASEASRKPSHFSRWPDEDSVPVLLLSLRSTVLLL